MFEMIKIFSAAILSTGSILFFFFGAMLAIDLVLDGMSKIFNKMKG
jgi:hypothetical protein